MDFWTLLAVGAATFFFAGFVKGLVGLGLPTISMALLTLVIEPRLAISLILMPMMFSNLWQMHRGGRIRETVWDYRLFASVLVVSVALTVILTRSASDRVLLGVLGISLLLFTYFSWRRMVPAISGALLRPVEGVAATFAGLVGGMTAGWAAPVAMFLVAKRVKPEEFMRASGFLIAIGSLPLLVTYFALGFATPRSLAISTGMLIPTLLGYSTGEILRRRVSVEVFHALLLLVFLVFGLNLLRRAILGG